MGSVLAGAQVLRRVGAGTRADVYLGRVGEAAVALKVLRHPSSPADAERELAALLAAAGPHVVEVLDLGSAPDGSPVLVLELLQSRHLGALLAEREDLSPGEAITLLQPLATAVERMQGRGVAHGALSASAVLFRSDGAPVLARFGAARSGLAGHSPAAREADPMLRSDVAALRALALAVLDRVVDGGDAVAALRSWVEGGADGDFPAALAERVFDLGPAEPIRIAASGAVRGLLGRATPVSPPVRHMSEPATGLWRLVPEELRSLVTDRWDAVARRVARRGADGGPPSAAGLLTRLRGVRRRYWVAAAVSGAFLVAGSGLVALLEADAGAVASGSGDVDASQGSTPDPSHEADVGHVDDAERGTAGATPGESAPDEPVAAAHALLSLRSQCFADLDADCLDRVAHPGSSVLTDDRRALDAGVATGRVDPPWPDPATAGTVELVQDLGGAVLMRVDTPERGPASVLMVRTEAGWRIRDIVAGDQIPS
ncbi:protein kinase domain-containing protein [Diaminobutyricimonas aerilata]|uniref:protein kinase domain-containing protein n=1 Tax=Diaminobutyricimonas aerilata TaxID=1162967 RepID=UPI000C23E656|nr:protein kinase [Diaminobutyricimonas aerilata]